MGDQMPASTSEISETSRILSEMIQCNLYRKKRSERRNELFLSLITEVESYINHYTVECVMVVPNCKQIFQARNETTKNSLFDFEMDNYEQWMTKGQRVLPRCQKPSESCRK